MSNIYILYFKKIINGIQFMVVMQLNDLKSAIKPNN